MEILINIINFQLRIFIKKKKPIHILIQTKNKGNYNES